MKKTIFLLAVIMIIGCQVKEEVATVEPREIKGEVFQNQYVTQGFYPDNETTLALEINGALRLADPVTDGTVQGIIAPHAGYVYCATQAAAAFRAAADNNYRQVVVVGFLHRVGIDGFSVLATDGYRTPLGTSPVAVEAATQLQALPGGTYIPEAHANEHSAAVLMPWIQTVCGMSTPVVEILLGQMTEEQTTRLATALAELAGDDTLFVFSTDMSHFHDGATAEKMDGEVIDLLSAGKYAELLAALATRRLECCGSGTLQVAFALAEKCGWMPPRVLAYGHSGRITGDYSGARGVVGYMGAIWSTGTEKIERHEPITERGKEDLLQLARRSLETYVKTGDTISPPEELVMHNRVGAFVTLKKNGMLRGCIGNMVGREELPMTIIKMAIQAGAYDPRFPAVREEELAAIDIEISVLTPFSPCRNPEEIVIGRDGLVLSLNGRSGVFLPQVPGEQGWDLPAYLENICHKAGLPVSALKDPQAELYTFTAQVFGEKKEE